MNEVTELINGIPVKWYRKHANPFGYSVFYYDECFMQLSNQSGALRVSKHYHENGKFKHYCCTQLNGTYSSGDWFHKTWESMLNKICKEYKIKTPKKSK